MIIYKITTVILSVCVAFLFFFSFSGEPQIAYVDSNRLLNEYDGMIKAREEYQKKAATWQSNIDTLTQEVQREIGEYEKVKSKMSVKERELSEELIRTKQRQLSDYQKAMREKAVQEDQLATSQVLDEVNVYLKTYGEIHDYRIILAATDYGNIAYASNGLEITKEVLEGLNNQYRGL